MPQLVFLGIFQISAAVFYSGKMCLFLSSLYPQCIDPLLGFLARFEGGLWAKMGQTYLSLKSKDGKSLITDPKGILNR